MQNINIIIQNYNNKLEELNKDLIPLGYECVFNTQIEEQIKNNQKIIGIVVMDNPGQEEKEQRKYLVGKAGKAFNKILNSIGIKREELLVFNKSSITTPATADLNEIYKNEQIKQLFILEQEITTNVILEIQKLLKIPIMVHGYASYLKNDKKFIKNEKGNRPLYIFFKIIASKPEIKNYIHFYKHSSYGNLSKQITKYCNELNLKKINFNQYLELGLINRKSFYK